MWGLREENQQLCNSLPKKKSLIPAAVELEKMHLFVAFGSILFSPKYFYLYRTQSFANIC